MSNFNLIGLQTVYMREIRRTVRIISQTVLAPVISTSLYFVVFGAALGSTISSIEGVSYGAYIVPGLIMMTISMNSLAAASSGIYFPKWSGTIYELLTAPLSYLEICLGYVFAAVSRSVLIAGIIFVVSLAFVSISIVHPFFSIMFIILTATTFALFGFIIGLLAQSFDQLQMLPSFVITPLSFLGGTFYSIDMLPEFWQVVSMVNPFVYMINGLRYGFYGITDISPLVCLTVVALFALSNLIIVSIIFKTGYRLRP